MGNTIFSFPWQLTNETLRTRRPPRRKNINKYWGSLEQDKFPSTIDVAAKSTKLEGWPYLQASVMACSVAPHAETTSSRMAAIIFRKLKLIWYPPKHDESTLKRIRHFNGMTFYLLMSALFQLPSLCSAVVFKEDQQLMNSLLGCFHETPNILSLPKSLLKHHNPSLQGPGVHNGIWGGWILEIIPSAGAGKERKMTSRQ